MTARARVAWAEIAVQDLEGIVDHIAASDPAAAAGVLDRLETRARSLTTLAERGRVVPELAKLDVQAYRELIESPYRIVYRVGREGVLVLAVLDGRRDLEALLVSRAMRR